MEFADAFDITFWKKTRHEAYDKQKIPLILLANSLLLLELTKNQLQLLKSKA